MIFPCLLQSTLFILLSFFLDIAVNFVFMENTERRREGMIIWFIFSIIFENRNIVSEKWFFSVQQGSRRDPILQADAFFHRIVGLDSFRIFFLNRNGRRN